MSAELAPVPRVRRALLVAALSASAATSGCERLREMLPWHREEQEQRMRAAQQAAQAAASAERLRQQNESMAPRYGAPPAFDDAV